MNRATEQVVAMELDRPSTVPAFVTAAVFAFAGFAAPFSAAARAGVILLAAWAPWACVLLLAAWAAWCFRVRRFSDGAILVVALTALATYALPYMMGLVVAPIPAVLAVFVLSHWRQPSQPVWQLGLGRFGTSGAVAALLVASLVGAVAWAAAAFLPAQVGLWSGLQPSRLHGASLEVTQVVSLALLVGFIGGGAEEVLFRGALQHQLTRSLGPMRAVAIQAIAYAVACGTALSGASLAGLHGGARLISGAVIGLVLGLSLGFLRYLSAGLFAPWVAHAFANVAIVLAIRAG